MNASDPDDHDRRSWWKRHWILAVIVGFLLFPFIFWPLADLWPYR